MTEEQYRYQVDIVDSNANILCGQQKCQKIVMNMEEVIDNNYLSINLMEVLYRV